MVKLVAYAFHSMSGFAFQTHEGLEVIKSILNDFNESHKNNTNAYADIYIFDRDREWFRNHLLYNDYANESNKAFEILKNAISGSDLDVYLIDEDTGLVIGGPSIYDVENDIIIDVLKKNGVEVEMSHDIHKVLMSLVGD